MRQEYQLLHMCRAEYRMSLRANTWTLGKDSFTIATEVAGMPKYNLATTATVGCLNWLVRHHSNGSLSVYIGSIDGPLSYFIWRAWAVINHHQTINYNTNFECRENQCRIPARCESSRQFYMHILANRFYSTHAGGKKRFIGFVGFFNRFSVFLNRCRFGFRFFKNRGFGSVFG